MTNTAPPPEDATPGVSRLVAGSAQEPDQEQASSATSRSQAPVRLATPARAAPTVLEQLGGVGGVAAAVLPVLVFVVVNTAAGLAVAVWAALGAGVVIGIWRLARREPLQPAVSGIMGVALCALIAYLMGDARGFFLYGIWYSLVAGLAFAASIVVRRPLVGVIWSALNGLGSSWRFDRRIRFGYDVATAVWAVFFLARFGVQHWLYEAHETTLLGLARLAMGLPLTAVAALVTVWAIRRATRLAPPAAPPASS